MNNILCEDSTCLNTVSIMLNCDTFLTNEQHNRTIWAGNDWGCERMSSGRRWVVWRSCNQQQDWSTVITMLLPWYVPQSKQYRRFLVCLHSLPELVTMVVGGIGGIEGEWLGGAAINNKDHAHLWYIPYAEPDYSLPELTTAAVGSIGGVGEGEWFRGTAINKLYKLQASLWSTLNCDTFHMSKHYRIVI